MPPRTLFPRALRFTHPAHPTMLNTPRFFNTTVPRPDYNPKKTVEQVKSRGKTGPFSWKAGVLFLIAGAGLIQYFRMEKQRMERKRIADMTKGVGRPKVGGPLDGLVDHNGHTIVDRSDLAGRYRLVYFGFTRCPDICPEELDKMAQMIEGTPSPSYQTMGKQFINSSI